MTYTVSGGTLNPTQPTSDCNSLESDNSYWEAEASVSAISEIKSSEEIGCCVFTGSDSGSSRDLLKVSGVLKNCLYSSDTASSIVSYCSEGYLRS